MEGGLEEGLRGAVDDVVVIVVRTGGGTTSGRSGCGQVTDGREALSVRRLRPPFRPPVRP